MITDDEIKMNIDGLLLCSKCENQLRVRPYSGNHGFFVVDSCTHCAKAITDDKVNQIASFERAHEKPLGRMEDSEWCICGGKYIHVDTMQGTHPTEGDWTQDSYQCDKCKTWCIITWDTHGVETDRRYEGDEE